MIMAETFVRTPGGHGNLVVGGITVTPTGAVNSETGEPTNLTGEQLQTVREAAFRFRVHLSEEEPLETPAKAPSTGDAGAQVKTQSSATAAGPKKES